METCKQCGNATTKSAPWGFCSDACWEEFKRPAVGKPATYQIGSDYYPYTIIAVSPSGAKVTIKGDRVCGGGVLFEAAAGNEEDIRVAHRNKDGNYRVGRCGWLTIGERLHRMDPSF